MAEEKDSPYGCYFAKFLDAFTIHDADRRDEFDKNLDAWEVSVMVKARTPGEAYDKVLEIANRDTKQYQGELDGVSLEWRFAGVIELDPVMQDPLLDTEFIYLEHHEIKLADHLHKVRDKEQLCMA